MQDFDDDPEVIDLLDDFQVNKKGAYDRRFKLDWIRTKHNGDGIDLRSFRRFVYSADIADGVSREKELKLRDAMSKKLLIKKKKVNWKNILEWQTVENRPYPSFMCRLGKVL